ncbi:large subunit ribosomal protein L23 [Lewinella marina]|uniref:Large ribosomal subunit protein uL23 n=1 Tax=Neolewinella marina TaxID=438751 RepID=A0A2G0CHF1_9BACT|nr:50S ribosomal protein L23 [Neolewinella marina]NJB86107.1 large subunit ribosomal protein L23 [Neolewinella marina]PHK99415.1 50S ribosomal protein L23 [Neolewinella marina]
MAKNILIKSVVSEKAELLSETREQYTFVVNSTANKIQVRNAIEARYGVTVDSVNTMNMPGKSKNRSTKSGVIRGRVSGYKKAVVTLIEGDTIDLYNEY